ncbi:BADF TYPE ATPASE DOMAIN-CONTAINING PROTEIN [Ceraceosorus bombacis]|uniref:N-acetyl-D-glucosamine kinase n=1 Tax=Ceraceosorus bombacis TaxID=401625 RepID=A0A0P1BC37_9BASI|nr:BADF TYPE ATPASE DOMAIN-CONTAINING PROTEIN [Ceraceosorus bombacis]
MTSLANHRRVQPGESSRSATSSKGTSASSTRSRSATRRKSSRMPRLYLAVDCGGTKAAAAICDEQGMVRGRGFGGPANYTDVGLRAFLRSVDAAVREALFAAGVSLSTNTEQIARLVSPSREQFGQSSGIVQEAATRQSGSSSNADATASIHPSRPNSNVDGTASMSGEPHAVSRDSSEAVGDTTRLANKQRTPFEAAWFGIAGVDSPGDVAALTPHLASLLGLPHPSPRLIVANDTSLLASPVTDPAYPDTRSGVVVIAGTGSIVMSFGRREDGLLRTLGRVGGFGWLLGDEGSGYAVGRDAVRLVLDQADRERLMGDDAADTNAVALGQDVHLLRDRILKHWGIKSTDDLLMAVYSNDVPASYPAIGPSAAPSESASTAPSSTSGSRRGSSSEMPREANGANAAHSISNSQATIRGRLAGDTAGQGSSTPSPSTSTSEGSESVALPMTNSKSSAVLARAFVEPSANLLPPTAPEIDADRPVSPVPALTSSDESTPAARRGSTSKDAALHTCGAQLPKAVADLQAGASAAVSNDATHRSTSTNQEQQVESAHHDDITFGSLSPHAVAAAAVANAVGERKHRIASLTPLVFHLAFNHDDSLCLAILRRQASQIASQICEVLRPPDTSRAHLRADRSVLCCGGSLVGVSKYRQILVEELAKLGAMFERVEYVGDPARRGAEALAGVWESQRASRNQSPSLLNPSNTKPL